MRFLVTALSSVVLLLTGLVVPASAGPAHHQPSVGSCHDYPIKRQTKPTEASPAVACSARHTAVTFAVARFDGTVDAASDERAYVDCSRQVEARLGGPQVLTAYGVGYFYPTPAEIARGARWVRCDLVLYVDQSLAALPDPIVTDPTDDAIAHCGTVRKQTFFSTACSSPHTYRITGSAQLRGRNRAYSQDRVVGQALQRCQGQVLDVERSYVLFPYESEWRAGYRTVACESRTSS